MMKRVQFLVAMVMLVLIPVRALAAVTSGMCASAGHDAVHHAHSSHSDSASKKAHGDEPASGPKVDCGTCIEHCASTVVAVACPLSSLPAANGGDRPSCPQSPDLRFVPENLDPPPLAS